MIWLNWCYRQSPTTSGKLEQEVEQDTGDGEVSPYLCKGGGGVERGGDPRGRPGEEWRPGNDLDDGSALSSSRPPGSPVLQPPPPRQFAMS